VLRSHGLGRLMNPRRIPLTLGPAVGAACAAALIGLVPAARADEGPLEQLLGDTGFNSWTPTADADLQADDPSLVAVIDPDLSPFLSGVNDGQDDPLSLLLYEFDPSAFSQDGFTGIDPEAGGLPDNALADLVMTLDFADYATGLEGVGQGLTDLVQLPYDIVIALLYLPLLPFVLAAG
jgi:hypothetical protein